jgi:DNA-binding response OmpR family regulator
MKILIAEDDYISRKVLRLTLEQLGHEVLVADDGAEAWKTFDQEPVRIIISDWMMPNLNGLDLCRRVRERPRTPYTYVIILTAAHTTGDDYSRAIASGIDDFLTKPLDCDLLRTRLYVAERISCINTAPAFGDIFCFLSWE